MEIRLSFSGKIFRVKIGSDSTGEAFQDKVRARCGFGPSQIFDLYVDEGKYLVFEPQDFNDGELIVVEVVTSSVTSFSETPSSSSHLTSEVMELRGEVATLRNEVEIMRGLRMELDALRQEVESNRGKVLKRPAEPVAPAAELLEEVGVPEVPSAEPIPEAPATGPAAEASVAETPASEVTVEPAADVPAAMSRDAKSRDKEVCVVEASIALLAAIEEIEDPWTVASSLVPRQPAVQQGFLDTKAEGPTIVSALGSVSIERKGGGASKTGPRVCRFGAKCYKPDCKFGHPNRSMETAPPGFMFVCSNATQSECLELNVFGSLAKDLTRIQTIGPTTSIFLWNKERKTVYGVFQAVGMAALNLVPMGKFQAQIRVAPHGDVRSHEPYPGLLAEDAGLARAREGAGASAQATPATGSLSEGITAELVRLLSVPTRELVRERSSTQIDECAPTLAQEHVASVEPVAVTEFPTDQQRHTNSPLDSNISFPSGTSLSVAQGLLPANITEEALAVATEADLIKMGLKKGHRIKIAMWQKEVQREVIQKAERERRERIAAEEERRIARLDKEDEARRAEAARRREAERSKEEARRAASREAEEAARAQRQAAADQVKLTAREMKFDPVSEFFSPPLKASKEIAIVAPELAAEAGDEDRDYSDQPALLRPNDETSMSATLHTGSLIGASSTNRRHQTLPSSAGSPDYIKKIAPRDLASDVTTLRDLLEFLAQSDIATPNSGARTVEQVSDDLSLHGEVDGEAFGAGPAQTEVDLSPDVMAGTDNVLSYSEEERKMSSRPWLSFDGIEISRYVLQWLRAHSMPLKRLVVNCLNQICSTPVDLITSKFPAAPNQTSTPKRFPFRSAAMGDSGFGLVFQEKQETSDGRIDRTVLLVMSVVRNDQVHNFVRDLDACYKRMVSHRTDQGGDGEDGLRLEQVPSVIPDPKGQAPLPCYAIGRNLSVLLDPLWDPLSELTVEYRRLINSSQLMMYMGGAGCGKTHLLSWIIVLNYQNDIDGRQVFVARSKYVAGAVRLKVEKHLQLPEEHLRDNGPQFFSYDPFVERIEEAIGKRTGTPLGPYLPVREFGWPQFSVYFANLHRVEKSAGRGPTITPQTAWRQIRSTIEGGGWAARGNAKYERPPGSPLSKNEYLELGAKACSLDHLSRQEVYRVYEFTHKHCERAGLWSETHRLRALLQAMLAHPSIGPPGSRMSVQSLFDYVYLDEVQDFTPMFMAVLLASLGWRANRLCIAGDSAQSIQSGSSFNPSEVRILADFCGRPEEVGRPINLPKNYRSTGGILGLANFVRNLMSDVNPVDNPRGELDRGLIKGDKPGVILAPTMEAMVIMLARDKQIVCLCRPEMKEWLQIMCKEIISNRIALLERKQQRTGGEDEELQEIKSSALTLLTPDEAKGLEFSDVAILLFFSHSITHLLKSWKLGLNYTASPSPEWASAHFADVSPDFESELKLFYVAYTRALSRLFLVELSDSVFAKQALQKLREKGLVEQSEILPRMMSAAQWLHRGVLFLVAANAAADPGEAGKLVSLGRAALEKGDPSVCGAMAQRAAALEVYHRERAELSQHAPDARGADACGPDAVGPEARASVAVQCALELVKTGNLPEARTMLALVPAAAGPGPLEPLAPLDRMIDDLDARCKMRVTSYLEPQHLFAEAMGRAASCEPFTDSCRLTSADDASEAAAFPGQDGARYTLSPPTLDPTDPEDVVNEKAFSIANSGTVVELKSLQKSTKVVFFNRKGWTLAHSAASGGNCDLLNYVIGTKPNIRSEHGKLSPAHIAAAEGFVDVLEFLGTVGANFEAEAADGSRCMHFAAAEGRSNVVAQLGKLKCEVNAQTKLGATPLFMAAGSGHEECVRVLLKLGANLDIRTTTGHVQSGCSPKQIAFKAGNAAALHLLLDLKTLLNTLLDLSTMHGRGYHPATKNSADSEHLMELAKKCGSREAYLREAEKICQLSAARGEQRRREAGRLLTASLGQSPLLHITLGLPLTPEREQVALVLRQQLAAMDRVPLMLRVFRRAQAAWQRLCFVQWRSHYARLYLVLEERRCKIASVLGNLLRRQFRRWRNFTGRVREEVFRRLRAGELKVPAALADPGTKAKLKLRPEDASGATGSKDAILSTVLFNSPKLQRIYPDRVGPVRVVFSSPIGYRDEIVEAAKAKLQNDLDRAKSQSEKKRTRRRDEIAFEIKKKDSAMKTAPKVTDEKIKRAVEKMEENISLALGVELQNIKDLNSKHLATVIKIFESKSNLRGKVGVTVSYKHESHDLSGHVRFRTYSVLMLEGGRTLVDIPGEWLVLEALVPSFHPSAFAAFEAARDAAFRAEKAAARQAYKAAGGEGIAGMAEALFHGLLGPRSE